MAKLLNFAPCVAATVDAFTGELSLFSVIESVQPLPLRSSGPSEGDASGAVRYLMSHFIIVSQWLREVDDDNREFEQRVMIKAPDGLESILQPPTRFTIERPYHRVFHRIAHLGLRSTGTFRLTLQLRTVGQEDWQSVQEYPFIVQDVPAEQAPEPTGNGQQVAAPARTH